MTDVIHEQNVLELDDREHALIAQLVLQFAQSVDKPSDYRPDSIAYPVMFDMACGVLSKMDVEYVKPEKKS